MALTPRGVFEVHVAVADRRRSAEFYRRAIGCALPADFPDRDVTFLWMGPRGSRLLGLWGPACPDPPHRPRPVAFRAAARVRRRGAGPGSAAWARRDASGFSWPTHRGSRGDRLDARGGDLLCGSRRAFARFHQHARGRPSARTGHPSSECLEEKRLTRVGGQALASVTPPRVARRAGSAPRAPPSAAPPVLAPPLPLRAYGFYPSNCRTRTRMLAALYERVGVPSR